MTTTEVLQVPRPDGARVQVQVAGQADRPTLVLLQGQASSHDWWTDLRRRYEGRFRTVTMDYRASGSTLTPAGDLSTALLAADVIAVLDAPGVAKTHLYGTSMGGRVAQIVAPRYPGRVKSLVLACTSPGGTHATERSKEVRRALSDPDENLRRETMVRLFYTPAWGDDASRSRLLGDHALWADAFGDRFTEDDADHAFGGVHVMAYDGPALVGHASAVPRRIRFGGKWCTVGYVEAVATRSERQRAGIYQAVMNALHNEIQHRWSVGVLSTGHARGFYERLGWVSWEGPSYVLTEQGEVRTEDEDAGLMVRTFDGTPCIDPTVSMTCENRPGDAW